MKNKYSVATEFGTFTRTTARVYTHMTVICGLMETVIKHKAEKALAHAREQFAKYTEGAVIAGITGFAGTDHSDKWVAVQYAGFDNGQRICGFTQDEIRKWEARQQEIITNHDANLAKQLADNAQAIALKAGEDSGWSSRLDLAIKNADKYRKMGYAAYVIEVSTGKVVA